MPRAGATERDARGERLPIRARRSKFFSFSVGDQSLTALVFFFYATRSFFGGRTPEKRFLIPRASAFCVPRRLDTEPIPFAKAGHS